MVGMDLDSLSNSEAKRVLMKSQPTIKHKNHKLLFTRLTLVFGLILLFFCLNYRQLYSIWAVQHETQRLTNLAEKEVADDFHNPAAVEDHFAGRLSSDFWKFTVIDGEGKVSNESVWHSASILFNQGLTIQHVADPMFGEESAKIAHKPAPEQYNNVTLIGGGNFRPTPSNDVVLRFSSTVSRSFYGTAGVIFQPAGTLQKNGLFAKPFDMFGFSIAGKESSVMGANGPICYLALNWVPVNVTSLPLDASTWHTYEIRLQWVSKTEWSGVLKVDDQIQCQMNMPALGPVEVQVWSDNAWVLYQPRRWWEFAASMDLKLQNGGAKQFQLGMIQVAAEPSIDEPELASFDRIH
jgi:hypothetical protein